MFYNSIMKLYSTINPYKLGSKFPLEIFILKQSLLSFSLFVPLKIPYKLINPPDKIQSYLIDLKY